ncbi:MurR/RpiR family transcriptional regulator [Liquorilactobacillus mali]|uniref:RpiR family transcriptional regulator n=2 Tax=Liquorilactobacillus mali TaxID=1618 RepID=J1F508_9LACO|nr:MurR/RpiR family transcriptional regulator [Liquorilactobacillus mali]EJF01045.1 RpiR family transcriptional regulator [Liquorilactobacillus mali KCTC 3596 = DSM 20444]KRN09769.1 RpiR family transcriptional regulator [Liquorilactobacillus mali KCTC 3596 = DSM 20444]MDC7953357.1 MurR/RpiR family transcriptional regulator [Liquorilactobacillus mali]QFQ75481.1 MurR/RpiR family transcriptional regulator [Liquorilactobacillus mali]
MINLSDIRIKEIKNKEELLERLMVVGKTSAVNKKIAMYVEKNYNAIVFMTADKISQEIGVSQGSISRFCVKMQYRGYNDFLRYLQKIISSEMTTSKRFSMLDKEDDNDKNLNILNQEVNNLQELQELAQTPEYAKAVNLIAKSKKVFLISNRMSATILPYMNYILSRLRPDVFELRYGSPEWENIDLTSPEGIVVFTTVFPRYSRTLLEKNKRLKERGFKIVALTDSRLSPIVACSDVSLITPITVSSVFDVYSTPLLLINLLMRDVSKKIPNIDKRLDEIERINETNNSFFLH